MSVLMSPARTASLTSTVPAATHHHAARTAVVRVQGLGKRFTVRRSWRELLTRRPATRVIALDGVSFEAGEGEILGLLGPNGAGKTTLLKILSTLVLPDAGSAEIAGHDVVHDAVGARRAMAPIAADERSLDWRISGAENLRLFGTLHGLRGPALRSRIAELLARVDLGDAGSRAVGAYSSGMRQRLLIARALLSSPRVLLLDEPTRSLDPLAARSFRQFLRAEIAGRHRCTVLLATHDPDEALELSDRVAILHRGRLLALGAPTELRREFGEERYRVWCRGLEAAFVTDAERDGTRLVPCPQFRENGWDAWDAVLPAGAESAPLLAALVERGISVARFERIQPSVAELMECVMRRHPVDSHA